MIKYNVYYEGSLIDIVYYEKNYEPLQVFLSLVYEYNHDYCIKIERAERREGR